MGQTTGKNNLTADFLSIFNSMNEINNENLELTSIPSNLGYNKKKVFDSEEKEKEFLEQTHLFLVHPGIKKHIEKIKRYVNIRNLKSKIWEINKKCEKCNQNKYFISSQFKTTGRYESKKPFQKLRST